MLGQSMLSKGDYMTNTNYPSNRIAHLSRPKSWSSLVLVAETPCKRPAFLSRPIWQASERTFKSTTREISAIVRIIPLRFPPTLANIALQQELKDGFGFLTLECLHEPDGFARQMEL